MVLLTKSPRAKIVVAQLAPPNLDLSHVRVCAHTCVLKMLTNILELTHWKQEDIKCTFFHR